jgi:hypothetical protein
MGEKAMSKVDFKKELKNLYSAPKEPVMVDVPELKFLMVDGQGDPNEAPEFLDAAQALYGASFTLKFMLKKAESPGGYPDWVVPPLEGLWWSENMDDFCSGNKDAWQWTLMIMQPEFVTEQMLAKAIGELKAKKKTAGLDLVRLKTLQEGLSAQVMHIGPYAAEGPTIDRLHSFIKEKGCELRGKHHEIYLSDPQRTPPEKLKTIIRQPVVKPKS